MFARCQLTRQGDYVHDAITGETTPWVTIQRKEKKDPEDERYEAFLQRYVYKDMMEAANTYTTRRNGRRISKRTATV